MFVVTEADAALLRAIFEQKGELSAAMEVRSLFPGVTDNTKRARVRPDHRWVETAASGRLSGQRVAPSYEPTPTDRAVTRLEPAIRRAVWASSQMDSRISAKLIVAARCPLSARVGFLPEPQLVRRFGGRDVLSLGVRPLTRGLA
jgi:hypothetical protein